MYATLLMPSLNQDVSPHDSAELANQKRVSIGSVNLNPSLIGCFVMVAEDFIIHFFNSAANKLYLF